MVAWRSRTPRRLGRRAFLRSLAVGLGGGIPLLATRGQPSSQQQPTPPPTAAPAKPAEVKSAQVAPGKAGGPVTLKYMSWWWAEKGRNDAWRALVKKFHDSQNDIRIQEVSFPYSDYFNRVMTQIAGGRLDADVLSAYDELAIRLIKGNQLEPLDDLVATLGIKGKLSSMNDFVTSNGKLYALFCTTPGYALIYNKELYDKEGITKPPASQEEYFAVAKKVTHRPHQFGHAGRHTISEQGGWLQDITQWVLGYGGVWAKAKKPLVTTDPVINAVKAYKKLYDEAMPQGADASTYRRMAWEGKIVQYIDNSANINILKTGNPDIYPKIYTAPPPWENRRSIAFPSYVAIYAGSKNKEAARVWWEFVLKKENLGPLYEQALDIIPAYEGAIREEWLKSLHWVSGFRAANQVVLASTLEGFEANIAEFRQIVLQRVSEVLTAGKAPEQAMQEAQKELEDLATRI